MFLGRNKYLPHFLLKSFIMIHFMFLFSIVSTAQTVDNNFIENQALINPLLLKAFKNPSKVNPILTEHIKPTKYEMMHWPNYPLTADQIEARDKQYKQSFGQQIVGDIVDSYVNSLLYGRKTAPAVVPKF